MGLIRGNAAIVWTDSDDITTERVLLLREPLRELRPAHTQSVYVAESLDKQSRQTFTVGEGVDELVGRIRFADDPQGLLDLLKAGSKGRTLTYLPDLDDADRRYACLLISPISPTGPGMDSDTGVSFGQLDVEIRLRKTDKTPFADPWKQDRLFSWRAGGRMEEATYSRADVASYAALAGGGGFGTLTTAASGAARTHWASTATSKGPRTYPTLLLETSRTNRVLQSETFNSATWTKSVTLTSGQADPRGGTKGYLLSDASTAAFQQMNQTITLTVSTRAVLSGWFRQGTTQSTGVGAGFHLRTTGASDRIRINITWSSGKPTATVATGVAVGSPELWRGGWYRIFARSTGNLTTGSYTINCFPAVSAAAAKGNIYGFGFQVEQ